MAGGSFSFLHDDRVDLDSITVKRWIRLLALMVPFQRDELMGWTPPDGIDVP